MSIYAQDGDKIHVSHGAMSALEIQRNGSDFSIIKQGRAYTSAIQLKTAADDASSGFTLKGQGAGNGSFVGIGTGEPPYPLTIRDGTSAIGFEEQSSNSSATIWLDGITET